MTSSGRNKVLVILVIVLLLTNAGMLVYVNTCCGKEEKAPPMARGEWVSKELKLDSVQKKTYMVSRDRRDSALVSMQLELRTAKLGLIGLLSQPGVADSTIQGSIRMVAEKQQLIEREYFDHYTRMRQLLRPDQYPLLDSTLTRMVIKNTGGDNKK